MWRVRDREPQATVHVYDPSTGDGYGEDVGLGAWTWQADDQWHTVQQAVDRTTGTTTVWYDGRQVLPEQGIRTSPTSRSPASSSPPSSAATTPRGGRAGTCTPGSATSASRPDLGGGVHAATVHPAPTRPPPT